METNNFEYERARRKVKEIRGFYYNLLCYCIVIPALIIINVTLTPGYQWFWFSLIGWGTGLLMHGLSAFGYTPFLGKNWEERKLRELMDKENQQTKKYL